ncbi:fructose-1,6-bisphosphatase [Cetobacterium sp. 8H]|uniref:fructose-1,6-bisphosphatase n=1 Tax=Cetobacterium sp. 8H TaxID=2759681 RepID=UPI00163CF10C|nr:fructose-1,6-bisphosphatase [Cetobacterium sp. 8H]MBC2850717.1 fructose-1,6-bisphosphatase [Cetobacterium sp. 8H]
MNIKEEDLKYLKLLSKNFPSIGETATEIINLEAILSLPKGTEHFISDIHGEYEAFNHVLKNCSGVIKEKIEIIFGESLLEKEKNQLATVIYYPKEKIEIIETLEENMELWYKKTINRILKVLQLVSSKYTRSKVLKAMTKDFSYIIQELLYERGEEKNKKDYVEGIINTIIEINRGKEFIINVSNLIQRLVIDNLHIVGDIYDRGPYPHKIMDRLMGYHNVDIQWGNHDILWVGAACGQKACIANAIRICLRYSNKEILEDGYGINLLPLATLAMELYGQDECKRFKPKLKNKIDEKDLELVSKMHKTISIIQFKLEGEIIKRNPTFKMDDRLILNKLDLKNNRVELKGENYPLLDNYFPTVSEEEPYELTFKEKEILDGLVRSFRNSEKLQEHIKFLLEKGSVYLKRNSNLLFHGCIPLDEKGGFREVDIFGKKYSGKRLLEKCDQLCREGYYDDKNIQARDFIWYLWCGKDSSLFGKDKMKTFERYFLEDKKTHEEKYDYYYNFSNTKEAANRILNEFGIKDRYAHIINGHVPVKVKKGESPIKGEGKLLLIDGGFSRAYQDTTGIAGYTLIFNSRGKRLVCHEPFENLKNTIEKCLDIKSTNEIVDYREIKLKVRDTDIGKELESQVKELKKLLECYKKGMIKSN